MKIYFNVINTVIISAIFILSEFVSMPSAISKRPIDQEVKPLDVELNVLNYIKENDNERPISYWVIVSAPVTINLKVISNFMTDSNLGFWFDLPDGLSCGTTSSSENSLTCTILFPSAGQYTISGNARESKSNFSTRTDINIVAVYSQTEAERQLERQQQPVILEPIIVSDSNPLSSQRVNVPNGTAHIHGIVATYPYT